MVTMRLVLECCKYVVPACRLLKIIYKSCLDSRKFLQDWKKSNVVPVHKKNYKQLVKNYRPIFLLPICGKIFWIYTLQFSI